MVVGLANISSLYVWYWVQRMAGSFFSGGLLLLQLLSGLSTVQAASTPLYKDADASVEDRVADLLGRMTIEDKMAQLMQGALILSPP